MAWCRRPPSKGEVWNCFAPFSCCFLNALEAVTPQQPMSHTHSRKTFWNQGWWTQQGLERGLGKGSPFSRVSKLLFGTFRPALKNFEAGTELWEPAGRWSCSGAFQGNLQRVFEGWWNVRRSNFKLPKKPSFGSWPAVLRLWRNVLRSSFKML